MSVLLRNNERRPINVGPANGNQNFIMMPNSVAFMVTWTTMLIGFFSFGIPMDF